MEKREKQCASLVVNQTRAKCDKVNKYAGMKSAAQTILAVGILLEHHIACQCGMEKSILHCAGMMKPISLISSLRL